MPEACGYFDDVYQKVNAASNFNADGRTVISGKGASFPAPLYSTLYRFF